MFRLYRFLIILILLVSGTGFSSFSQELINVLKSEITLNAEQQKYKAALLQNTEISDYQFVTINADSLASDNYQSFQLNVPNELSCTVTREKSYRVTGNRLVWIGRSKDIEGFVRLVVHGDIVNAKIDLIGYGYSIFPLTGGLHIMFKDVDAERGHCDEEGFQAAPGPNTHYDAGDPNEPDNGSRAGECSLRMMVVFTQAVKSASADVTTLVEGHVADWNTYNANSNVDYTVQLARCISTTYVATGAAENHPTYGNDSQDMIRLYETSDGFMDEMHGIRNQYDADLVSLFVTTLHSGGGEALPIGAVASDAFHTMLWNNGASTFAHESGHLFGLRHSHDSSTSPYAYGHGWDVNGSFATVMAYTSQCSPCVRAPNWSNPSINVNGVPSGSVGFGDAARVNREQDQTMASFQLTVSDKLQFVADVIGDEEQADLLGNNFIETNSISVTVESGGSATYRAANHIKLEPGFHAKSGSQFHAFLDNCTAMNRISSDQQEEEPVSAPMSEGVEMIAFPNPFNQSLTVSLTLENEAKYGVYLMDMYGKTVKQIAGETLYGNGTHLLSVDVRDLAAGMYMLVAQGESNRIVKRLMRTEK
jgi:hypothetical protein